MADLFSPCALRTLYQSLLKTKLANLAVSHQQLLSLHSDSLSPWSSFLTRWRDCVQERAMQTKGYKIPNWELETLCWIWLSIFSRLYIYLQCHWIHFLIYKLKGIRDFIIFKVFLSCKSNSWTFPFQIMTSTFHGKHLLRNVIDFFFWNFGVWFAEDNYLRHSQVV